MTNRERAVEELKLYLLLKHRTSWNTPKQYWDAAVDMMERALAAEAKLAK